MKGREAARAVHSMVADASAWEAVLLATVFVETEQCTINLSLTFQISKCSFGLEAPHSISV